ncbi:uncharacterized protein LOC118349674 [Juglans regia]|uniref:Uncharacterized protein LOC118349674 n=1 Tax=Juglans regia TaxID=51240 RepID=A0A6P9ETW4_JUGRE|nr:uncharacterized protein LOC118349674 [Juglans regia]
MADPNKVKAMLEWLVPTSVKSLRALRAFNELKSVVTSPPVLNLSDFSKPFTIVCDASGKGKGIGVVLMQLEQPLAYLSKEIKGKALLFSTYEKELLGQFITDNDASYKAARKKLQQKYGSFYWSPCAAHCIDLMLENFPDPRHFTVIDETIKKARKITKFIYNHAWVLALMKKDFTRGHDLCRPAVTSFATNFLSIRCLLLFKKELKQMFTCDKWIALSHSKSNIGKEISEIVLEDREFWAQCQFIVKVTKYLVLVLRLVDGEEKPAMGYLYDAMERGKENIKARCNDKVTVLSSFIRIIDARWDKQLHNPLHAAGCFLNPAIYYNPCFKNKNDVARGFMACIMRMELDIDNQDKIIEELELYRNADGDFGHSLAICQRDKINPN